MEKLNDFINWIKNNGWKITLKNNDIKNLPQNVFERYDIPIEYKQFLENIGTCVNANENVWFLCIDDYLPKPEDAFR
ncbi:MAG: hypothetical protein LBK13_12815, partial [Spirochaetales bacterium]|nr:hypothetical protein [Spirochaetales bacterium]